MTAQSNPLPVPTVLSRPFWEAAAKHRLVIQRCESCRRYEWVPQIRCSACLQDALKWVDVSGRAKVFTFSVVHRSASPAFEAPYVLAIVELEEGSRLMTNLIDVPVDEIAIGLDVRVVFQDVGGCALPKFTVDQASPPQAS